MIGGVTRRVSSPVLVGRDAEAAQLRAALQRAADGRTNRQIAETLFISNKTASVHVSNILAKLGAANRGEAAAIAHRLHLTR
jgi:DNA-binding NarL/FixJ family response regulator